ncbi:MAG: glycosyltransferase [Roseovarius sp.]|jgi:glycosyltransferase involved in cell wall biosynthesis|nr:glycosyltransferase [Roseovarius sp.]
MRAIRVVQLVTRLDIGGAQETVLAYARERDPELVDVSVLAGPVHNFGGSSWDAATKLSNTAAVRHLVGPVRPFSDLRALVELYLSFRRTKPDVVHTHSSKAGFIGRLAARAAGVPVIVHTVHGWSFRDYQPRFVSSTYAFLERVVARVTDVIVVVTPADIDEGLARGIGRPGQYRVVRSGIDLEAFRRSSRDESRRRLGISGTTFVWGTVCRLEAPKDVATLLTAFALDSAPARTEILVIIGDGPHRSGLEGLARELGIRDRVRFEGLRRDVAELLPGFDGFVLSSKSEGMPRVLVEAAASGVPIVASRVGGVPEAFGDGEAALLVPPSDVSALHGALVAMRDDKGLRCRLAENASAVAERFDSVTMAAELTRIYEQLIAARRP